ncbi:MAG: six-hairpin glycosidase-like protein, partial [Calditrichota bacterium]
QIRKIIYPSMEQRLLVEEWQVKNIDAEKKEIAIANVNYQRSENGYKGTYSFIVRSDAPEKASLASGKTISFPVYYGATLNDESAENFNAQRAYSSRMTFLKTCRENLVLTTPDKTINTLFYFSKIRAAESIYNSSMGLVHSPGGGNYYVGIWANDQVEYSGPFFPYLGYPTANEAAFNTYNKFLQNIPKNDHHIPYAFEVDGNFAMTHLDRGDAAMIAYGTSQYLLASGNIKEAKKLWPLIEWSLDYCHRNRNADGAVQSESDEMEGRIETGKANLSTSTLYYGGLAKAAQIAAALDKPVLSATYQSRHAEMREVIENYFGSVINRLKTYRYYDGNTTLRHWICLPLVMGITERKNVTLDALFNRLWTDNGILVEYYPGMDMSKAIFWDRATLYALRGALTVGETELAFARLHQYSQKRLLGDHVPYAIEAWPENNMKHLSAESALY